MWLVAACACLIVSGVSVMLEDPRDGWGDTFAGELFFPAALLGTILLARAGYSAWKHRRTSR